MLQMVQHYMQERWKRKMKCSHFPKVDLSFRLRLQKARTAKQMSQKDLAVVGNVWLV